MKISACLLSFLPIVFFLIIQNESANAQSVGERVVVTADIDTKIRATKVGKVYGGAIHTITAIQGKWCFFEGVRGWVPLQYTMSLSSAKKLYEKRIKVNKEDYDAFSVLGMIAFEQGDSRTAISRLNSALKLNNKVASIWNNRAVVLSSLGRYDEALRDISAALKLNAKYAGAYGNRGLIYVALADPRKAVRDFNFAIQYEPKNPIHYKNRGSAYQSLGKADEALADFNKSIRIDSRLYQAYIGRANVYLARDDFKQAFVNASEAVRLNPKSASALNNRGWVRYRQGDLEGAIEDLDRALKLDSDLAIAYNNRGVVLVEQGKFDLAIANYNRALKIDPRSAITFSNRANAYIGLAEYARAKKDFDTALKLVPSLPDAKNGYAWFLATCPDEKYRDGEKSLALIGDLLEATSADNWSFIDTKAAALAELEQFDKAVETQKTAIKIVPEKSKDSFEERLAAYQAKKPFRTKTGKPQRRSRG
jgi:tetratricopeptide (TPR) repeat protein